jgi:hypothetical protein
MPLYGSAGGGANSQSWELSPFGQAVFNPNNYTVDARGAVVTPDQPIYISAFGTYPGGGSFSSYSPNPQYDPNWNPNSSAAGTPAPPPPQYQFTFDTIGQTIFRTIGHCRLPLRPIWAEGIDTYGQTTTNQTLSFAAALCAPLDPTEDGSITSIFLGNSALFDAGSVVVPSGMDDTTAAQLKYALENIRYYPGTEDQEPDSLIVADKGASLTNAFRGLRYIVFPSWPLAVGMPSNLSAQFTRTNTISYSATAVEFAAGTA